MRFLPLTILASALLVPSVSNADEKSELKKLAGNYKIIAMSAAGKKAPAEALKAKMTIVGKVMTMVSSRNGMQRKRPLDAKLDGSKSPKHITLSKEGKTRMVGIYKLEGKKLTFCFAREGKERPTKFESKAGVEWMMMVLERTK